MLIAKGNEREIRMVSIQVVAYIHLLHWYGKAIRENNGDYCATRKAMCASLCHRASTDENPRHEFCPNDSCCGYHKAAADKPYEHHNPIPKPIYKLMVPVYRDLADNQLLLKCEKGATQNRNECFNKLVWSYLPKTEFAGACVVNIAVYLAVIHFNHGIGTFEHILCEMNCPVGDCTRPAFSDLDVSRMEKSLAKCSAAAKSRRKRLRRIKKGLEDETVETEEPTFGSGMF